MIPVLEQDERKKGAVILKKKPLPVFGVGPVYVISCLLLTIFGFAAHRRGYLDGGAFSGLKLTPIIIGVIFIVTGMGLWICAVLVQKISDEIKRGELVTSGIYSVVRNPIYSAFFLTFTGALLTKRNWYLLVLPIVFYVFLTILLKRTEEKWLLKRFGNRYKEYCAHVNRVIPWFRH